MPKHFPGATKMVSAADPPRPTSNAVAAALIAAADGEPLLADRPAAELVHDLQVVTMASGWRLEVWWRDGLIGPLHAATSPQGLQWCYGCARWPDWEAGPAAVVLCPIRHLLSDEQRARLRARLLSCSCWPVPERPALPEPPPLSELTDLELMPG